MNHTAVPGEQGKVNCDCEPISAVPFLDTLCSIKEGRIYTDFYKKTTDRNRYLLQSSCHPKKTTLAIPKSLAIRIVKICSNPNTRHHRFHELQDQFLERGYQKDNIESAIKKARCVPKEALLKKVVTLKENKRPVFSTE